MFGANKHEGKLIPYNLIILSNLCSLINNFWIGIFVAEFLYGNFLVPNNLDTDEEFLKYELVPTILNAIGTS